MKKILLLLLFSLTLAQAQTSYKDVDIKAQAGNEYETLLTNVLYDENDFDIYNLLHDLGYNTITVLEPVKPGCDYTIKFDKEQNNNETVYVHYIAKSFNQTFLTTKVEIYGNVKSVIRFYLNFWSSDLNFEDIKIGEVVSTRFLTDVATLSFPDKQTAKITVVTAKNR